MLLVNTKDNSKGETSPFEALTTAMSGAVGTGNIGGVALAIWIGGPAAIFWMWITAIFGMTTKFVEVTLAHKYRTNYLMVLYQVDQCITLKKFQYEMGWSYICSL